MKVINQESKIALAKVALNRLSEIKDRPLDKKGNLDVQAFNELPEVKIAVARLKRGGITKKWLWKHFMVAGMLLKI